MEVVLPQQFPTYDKMRKGTWIISVATHEHQYYTGLQVTKDPGVPVVYAGFVLMIIGCFVAFFMSHKKLGVEVSTSGGSSKVRVAGTANKNKLGMNRNVQVIAKALAGLK
jgi:cytochrome c biogenesis protein